jgi:hypothetical protein
LSPWEFPGFVSGLAATWMFLVAVLVAAAASVRVLTTLRRPGKGGGARGLLVWAGLVGIAAIVLFALGQTPAVPSGAKIAADAAAPWIAGAALLAAPLLAWSFARRLRRRAASAPAAQIPGVAPVDGERGDEAKE